MLAAAADYAWLETIKTVTDEARVRLAGAGGGDGARGKTVSLLWKMAGDVPPSFVSVYPRGVTQPQPVTLQLHFLRPWICIVFAN